MKVTVTGETVVRRQVEIEFVEAATALADQILRAAERRPVGAPWDAPHLTHECFVRVDMGVSRIYRDHPDSRMRSEQLVIETPSDEQIETLTFCRELVRRARELARSK